MRRWRAEHAEPLESLLARLSEAYVRRADLMRVAAAAENWYLRGVAEEAVAAETRVIHELRYRLLIQRGVPRATVDAVGEPA